MRNMSFFLTTQQIIDETKTVTRRFGWGNAKPGDRVMACEKCQGLKKGEKINKLKVIEVVSTRWEPLCSITKADCILEGFPDMSPEAFTIMIMEHYKCPAAKPINRIEFKYVTALNP